MHVVVDEMVEDDKLQDDALVITYPKMLHVVQDEDQLDIQMEDYEISKDSKPSLIRFEQNPMMNISRRIMRFM